MVLDALLLPTICPDADTVSTAACVCLPGYCCVCAAFPCVPLPSCRFERGHTQSHCPRHVLILRPLTLSSHPGKPKGMLQ